MSLRLLALVAILASYVSSASAAPIAATLYKNPRCDCCESYAAYLRRNGFAISVVSTFDLAELNQEAGIPDALQGCHLMRLSGYVIGGHVPVEGLRRLLRERPAIRGITVPGMPNGSPGMGWLGFGHVVVYALDNDGTSPVYGSSWRFGLMN